MSGENTVVLRVQLSEEDTEKRLALLTTKLADTRKESQELTKAYSLGKVSAEEYGQQSVQLNSTLRMTQTEQRNLTRTLDAYRAAQQAEAGSYEQAQKQLDVANAQFKKVAGSQDLSTESAKELSKVIADLRGELTKTDASNELFARSVGRYPKNSEGLESLVAQLVRLQEETKGFATGTDEAARAQMRIIGFQQAATQAGAKNGLTYEETTAKISAYTAAIRPATAALVQLEKEQQAAALSGEASTETLTQIGFKLGQAEKSLKAVTDELQQVPGKSAPATAALAKVPDEASKAAEETKGFGAQLLEAAGSSDKLGGTIEVLTGAKEKYIVATNLAKAAVGGEVTVLGLLRAALLATGLGALVVVLGLIITGLLKSQAATDFLGRKMAALGGVIQPLLNLGAELAEKLVAAAEDPKQAFEDLVRFLETNIANRFKAVGVIIDAIRNRDFGKLTDGVVQLGTGVTNATAKFQALTTEMNTAATAAEAIAAQNQKIREAERALNIERDQSRAKIEGLKKLADDTTKSIPARTAAAKEAAAIENRLLAEQEKLQDAKIANLKAEQALKKSLSTEDKDALADLLRERAQSTQESLTLQTELQNTLNGLVQEGLDKSITARQQALAVEASLLAKRLAQVKQNSDEELSLEQQKLRNAYQAEVNVKNLTVAQKKKADLDYETASLALSQDFARRRATAAYEAQLATVQAELLVVRKGTEQETELRVEAINTVLAKELASLEKRGQNVEKAALLRAKAEADVEGVRYAAAQASLEAFLQGEQNSLDERLASGKLREAEYNQMVAASDVLAANSRLQLARQFNQQSIQQEQALAQAKIAQIKAVSEAEKKAGLTTKEIADKRLEVSELQIQAATNFTDTIISLLGEESEAGRAALAVKKILALSEIALNLQKVISANSVTAAQISATIPPPVGPVLGTAYKIAADAVAITAAALAASNILKLQRGGLARVNGGLIAQGPSHIHGGIPLYRGGQPAGIEIEGMEPVLTANVTRNPLLLSIASLVNQAAGGRALVPGIAQQRMTLGGVTTPTALVQQQLSGGADMSAHFQRLGQQIAKINIYVKTQEFMASQDKVNYAKNTLGSS